ncbi:MAG: hypothetical protein LBD14_03935 [Puniceicoccales bacterium]|jgi:thiosulfate dehydrogenase [quinone] large subunit|nr:hypothetical protein [Puniceicoccales bacterium]
MSKTSTHDNNPSNTGAGDSCCCADLQNSCACDGGAEPSCGCPVANERTLAFWILRVWLGARALLTGLSKFSIEETVVAKAGAAAAAAPAGEDYGIKDAVTAVATVATEGQETVSKLVHHGLPTGGAWTYESFSNLTEWPRLGWLIMPKWALWFLDNTLGYILIALGATLLLGIGTRISLLAQGLLYTALTAGFIIITKEPGSSAGITMLGVHIVLVVAALLLVKHNRFVVCKKF